MRHFSLAWKKLNQSIQLKSFSVFSRPNFRQLINWNFYSLPGIKVTILSNDRTFNYELYVFLTWLAIQRFTVWDSYNYSYSFYILQLLWSQSCQVHIIYWYYCYVFVLNCFLNLKQIYNDWLNPNEILKGNKHSYLSLGRLCTVSICFLSRHIRILDIMVNFGEISKLGRNISWSSSGMLILIKNGEN